MKKLLLLIAVVVAGCSSDNECKTCEASYYNPYTNKFLRESTTDCDMVVPEGYYFVECLTISY